MEGSYKPTRWVYKDGINWYAYVGNDPMNGVDPSGKAAQVCLVPAVTPVCVSAIEATVNAVGAVIIAGVKIYNEASDEKVTEGERTAEDPLPRDKNGHPVPESEHPHTQLGTKKGSKGKYRQGREFGNDGEHIKDIDFTDHGRSDHDNPHEHPIIPNKTGGTPMRGPAQPLKTCIGSRIKRTTC